MGTKNLSDLLLGSGNTDKVEFNGGVNPGIVAGDGLGDSPMAWTLSVSAALYSLTAQSCVPAALSTSTEVGWIVSGLIKELGRKGLIKVTVTNS